MKFRITAHAEKELIRREIPHELFVSVLESPGQVFEVEPGLSVFQSKFSGAKGKAFLIRVFVGLRTTPHSVVTVYKTTQVDKYWRNL